MESISLNYSICTYSQATIMIDTWFSVHSCMTLYRDLQGLKRTSESCWRSMTFPEIKSGEPLFHGRIWGSASASLKNLSDRQTLLQRLKGYSSFQRRYPHIWRWTFENIFWIGNHQWGEFIQVNIHLSLIDDDEKFMILSNYFDPAQLNLIVLRKL